MKNFYEKFVKKYDLNNDEIVNVRLVGKEPENQVLIMDLKGSIVLSFFGSLNAIRDIMKETLVNDYQIAVLGKDFDDTGLTIKYKLGEVLYAYAKAADMDDDLFKEMFDVIQDGIVCSLYKEHDAISVIGVRLEDIVSAA